MTPAHVRRGSIGAYGSGWALNVVRKRKSVHVTMAAILLMLLSTSVILITTLSDGGTIFNHGQEAPRADEARRRANDALRPASSEAATSSLSGWQLQVAKATTMASAHHRVPAYPPPPELDPVDGPAARATAMAAGDDAPAPPRPARGGRQRTPARGPQLQVVNIFRWSWTGYCHHAWGADVLLPISRGHETLDDIGLTIVEAADSMWIMNLRDEYEEARQWVAEHLSFADKDRFVSTSELIARCLGGLLSAYVLSGDALWLQKAEQLGERLLPAFRASDTGLPYPSVNLRTGEVRATSTEDGRKVRTLEASGALLELRALSHFTGRAEFAQAVDRAGHALRAQLPPDGLVRVRVDISTGAAAAGAAAAAAPTTAAATGVTARLEASIRDLLRAWIQSNKSEDHWREWYLRAVEAINTRLLRYTAAGEARIAELQDDRVVGAMDQQTCAYAGALALGAFHGLGQPMEVSRYERPREELSAQKQSEDGAGGDAEEVKVVRDTVNAHLQLAGQLAETCYSLYGLSALKLAPGGVRFNVTGGDGRLTVDPDDAGFSLQPEAAEAMYMMYRVTRDNKYRKWGSAMLNALEKRSKIPSGGFAGIADVTNGRPVHVDRMDSVFLAATLKYFYLLYTKDESFLRLDRWVITSAGHLLPLFPP